uniref:ABC transporter domain-containing protein n=1 Tax=Zea mays TaxID=4577 RepID=A0A804Q8K5_MAIZE
MDQQQYWTGDEREYQYHSIEMFAKCFRACNLRQLVEDEKCNKHIIKQDMIAFQANDRQSISNWNIFKACFVREILLLKRNSPVQVFKAIQITFLAFILSTLFFRTEMRQDTIFDGNKYMGALFMAVAAINFNGMIELTMTVKRLPVFYKQRELLWLPGWAILCSIFLVSIPMSLMETGLWTCSTYFAIGYAPSPDRFFQQLLVLFVMHQMSMGLYRFLASLGRTQVMANMLGTEALIAIFILGGFIVSKAPKEHHVKIKSQKECDIRYIDQTVGGQELRKNGVTEKKLQLLRDVNGAFRPGVLTALMGITGAGKTTLLDVLAGRKTGGYIEGIINIGGYQKKQDTFSKISGYCEQTDIHSPYLTVYESLQFSAYLRLPSDVSPHKRDMFVEEVMGLVELRDLRCAIVGAPGVTGLSSEQRKRLTIAVELVASPSIIFMDEPTTGLDARAAAIVMRTAIPGVPSIKDGQNPAAWMLDITSHTMEYTIRVDYSEVYRKSSLHRENMALVDELSKRRVNQKDLHFPPGYWPNFKAQCMACLWKQHCSFWKNPELNVARFLNTFGISMTFGIVFWQIGSTVKEEQDVFNILGIAYASALFLGLVNCSTLQPILAMEKVVFYREKASDMYSSMAYVITQIGIEIPYMIIQVFIFSAIVYPMAGFQLTVTKFFWFVLYMILSFTDYTLYGMMAVALAPSIEIASGLSFLIFMIWNVFSGFIVSRKMMPPWWRWMYWADPAAWTVYGLMFSQLGDCTELIHVPGQPDQPVRLFLEEYLGLQGDYFILVTVLHIALSMLFGIVFYISIKYLKFHRR